jgi:hypothetical protein
LSLKPRYSREEDDADIFIDLELWISQFGGCSGRGWGLGVVGVLGGGLVPEPGIVIFDSVLVRLEMVLDGFYRFEDWIIGFTVV